MHWTGQVESVAFTLFGKTIAWYGIIITAAMVIGLLVGIRLARRTGIKSDDALELFLIAIPLAIVGARLGWVFANLSKIHNFLDVIAVWDGGLTILTGAPMGILGGFIWCKWRKVNFWKLADSVVFVILLSQGLGRWGNFMNQELYGVQVVTDPNMQWFPLSVFISRGGLMEWHPAAFFYEMVLDILFFFVLFYISRHLYLTGSGVLQYLCTYCIIRFVMEFFRTSTDMFGIPHTAQIACAVGAVLSLGAIVFMAVRKVKRKEKIWYKDGIPDEFFIGTGIRRKQKEEKTPTPSV
ncbi:MAG: prolipoprotein diacylglyceryl transferase [Clostridia bacterium]|nr:prolipoprotein diacylglyceryl transferase [Clostridia bacterium]